MLASGTFGHAQSLAAVPTIPKWKLAKLGSVRPVLKPGVAITAVLLLAVPLMTLAAAARGGSFGGGHGGFGGGGHIGGFGGGRIGSFGGLGAIRVGAFGGHIGGLSGGHGGKGCSGPRGGTGGPPHRCRHQNPFVRG